MYRSTVSARDTCVYKTNKLVINGKAVDIKDVKKDGNCLFRVLSLALFKKDDSHEQIKEKVVETLIMETDF